MGNRANIVEARQNLFSKKKKSEQGTRRLRKRKRITPFVVWGERPGAINGAGGAEAVYLTVQGGEGAQL